MKKTLLLILSFFTIGFGLYASFRMIFKNRAPYTLACEGMILDKSKVYLFDNSISTIFKADTVQIKFEHAKAIMPKRIGVLVFKNEWIFEPSNDIKHPSENAILAPTCRSLNSDLLNKGLYFSGKDVVPQNELIQGIKINSRAGDKHSRVLIQLLSKENDLVLKTNAVGLMTQYLIEHNQMNTLGVYINQTPSPTFKNNFLFSNLTSDTVVCQLNINVSTFNASVDVIVEDGHKQSYGPSNRVAFRIKNFCFTLTPKLKLIDLALLVGIVCLCLIIQLLLLRQAINKDFASPIIWTLFSTRILFNNLFFLAIPTYILSLTATGGRWLYLIGILLFNLSILINRNSLHFLVNLKVKRQFAILCLIITLIFLPVFKFFTFNESLLGVIPTLHLLKWVMLLFILSILFFFNEKNIKNSPVKYGVILLYAGLATVLTKDFGSAFYTFLSLILIALVTKDKKIRPIYLVTAFIILVLALLVAFNTIPEIVQGKGYRLYAPYTSPADAKLDGAKEADREFYAMLDLNLKNVLNQKLPIFENINIPPNARSTGFSDYAFHWSLTMGGLIWAMLFFITISCFFYNLLFLLFCSCREIKINKNLFFIFPITIESQLIRFLLAFCCVGLFYPILSNLCLVPLTGQSILVLSISFFEVLFFTLTYIVVESIFTNPDYYFEMKSGYKYSVKNLEINVITGFIAFLVCLATGLGFKTFHLDSIPDRLEWQISLHNRQALKLPPQKDSLKLLVDSKFKDSEKITDEDKIILREASSRLYTGKPYSAHVYTPKRFGISSKDLIEQMHMDSVFNYDRKRISGPQQPFGEVFAFEQKVNTKTVHNASNPLYKCVPFSSTTVNADLTAELNKLLQEHIKLLPLKNIGGIMITDRFGGIVANATMPYDKEYSSLDRNYFIGSVKKILLAYCALAIDPAYKQKSWKGRTFKDLIVNSDSYYAGELLRDLLVNHNEKFGKILKNDFHLALFSNTELAFMDEWPTERDFAATLSPESKNNSNSKIYRYAIGQQKPYPFRTVVDWFSRIAFNIKGEPSFHRLTHQKETLSIAKEDLVFLHSQMQGVMMSTAFNVGVEFRKQSINGVFMAKTGTAQHSDFDWNQSSSFVIFDDTFCVGVFLDGHLPDNKERLGAKHLFEKMIPLLLKYEILKRK